MLGKLLRNLISGPHVSVEDDALRLARDLYNESQHDEAVKVLTTLIEYKPDCVEALMLCGAAKRAAGRTKEGLADLARAGRHLPRTVRRASTSLR